MNFRKFYAFAALLLALCGLVVACGQLFESDKKGDSGSHRKFDERLPSDWDLIEDWPGSDWEVIEE